MDVKRSKVTMYSLFTSIYLLLNLMTMTQVTKSNGISNNFLTSFPNVSWPTGLNECTHLHLAYRLSCVQNCTLSSTCASAYTVRRDSVSGSLKWNCSLCKNTVPWRNLASGSGHYSIMKLDAVFKTYDIIKGHRAAVYKCTLSGGHLFYLSYNRDSGREPEVHSHCLERLCMQDNIEGVLLNVTSDGADTTMYRVIRNTGETSQTIYSCHADGTWTQAGKSGISCTSTCYTVSSDRRANYCGEETMARDGIVCQHWNQQSPHHHGNTDHNFPYDGYSIDKAQNFCRDPDRSGFPWCYVMGGDERWNYCNVPLCD